ncbi:MAG TPA: hypothetical protein VFF10_01650 [Trueperaceae bacterium]|nr:hypothetical protein [Trueperaceae bacterium]
MNDEGRREEDQRWPDEPWLEEPDAAVAAEVLTASLGPEELPPGGWDRLRAAAVGAQVEDVGAGPVLGRSGRVSSEDAPHTPGPPPTQWSGFALALAATVLLVVAGLGVWGVQHATEAARLRDDQRILAYWMGNPDMRMVSLQPASGSGDARMGVLCVLPDGRALVLQPNPAGRGETYVVVGRGLDGVRELARGDANMIQFDASGVETVELRLTHGNATETLAFASLR